MEGIPRCSRVIHTLVALTNGSMLVWNGWIMLVHSWARALDDSGLCLKKFIGRYFHIFVLRVCVCVCRYCMPLLRTVQHIWFIVSVYVLLWNVVSKIFTSLPPFPLSPSPFSPFLPSLFLLTGWHRANGTALPQNPYRCSTIARPCFQGQPYRNETDHALLGRQCWEATESLPGFSAQWCSQRLVL